MKPAAKNLERYAEAQLRARLKKVGSELRRQGKHGGDAETIHDLRVAIRRFTQALRVFEDLLDAGDARQMRRRVRRIRDLCGGARDFDIAMEVLRTARVPVTGVLKKSLEKRRTRAIEQLAAQVKDWALSAKLRAWRGRLRAKSRPRQSIASEARLRLLPLANEFFAKGAAAARPGSYLTDIHRCRLGGKRLRS